MARYEYLPLPLSVDGTPRRARFKVIDGGDARQTEVLLQVRHTRSCYWDSPFAIWVSVGRIRHPYAMPDQSVLSGEPGYDEVIAEAKQALLDEVLDGHPCDGDAMSPTRMRRGRTPAGALA